MDITQLKSFIRIALYGSFSEAASSLGLTQPAISRQIKQLEQELGFALIDREKRPIVLTTAGKEFLVSAQNIVDEIEATIIRHKVGTQGIAGRLLVVSRKIPGDFLAPTILAQFTTRHSMVRPALKITDSPTVVDDLLAHRAEVGFLGTTPESRALRLIPIAHDEIVLAVPTTHTFSTRKAIKLSELVGQPMVEREEGSNTRKRLLRATAEKGLSIPDYQVVMVMGSSQSQLAAIAAGVGVGFVSSLVLNDRVHRNVVGLHIEDINLHRIFYLAHERSPLSPVAKAFVNYVAETYKEPSLAKSLVLE
jgi:DNA-binding transcriptional LysR family regulator